MGYKSEERYEMITQYKCSYCPTVYMDKALCEEHEKRHATEDKFTITRVGYAEKRDCFPQYMEISMTDSEGDIYIQVYEKSGTHRRVQ